MSFILLEFARRAAAPANPNGQDQYEHPENWLAGHTECRIVTATASKRGAPRRHLIPALGAIAHAQRGAWSQKQASAWIKKSS
jgi:hypothetical protein